MSLMTMTIDGSTKQMSPSQVLLHIDQAGVVISNVAMMIHPNNLNWYFKKPCFRLNTKLRNPMMNSEKDMKLWQMSNLPIKGYSMPRYGNLEETNLPKQRQLYEKQMYQLIYLVIGILIYFYSYLFILLISEKMRKLRARMQRQEYSWPAERTSANPTIMQIVALTRQQKLLLNLEPEGAGVLVGSATGFGASCGSSQNSVEVTYTSDIMILQAAINLNYFEF